MPTFELPENEILADRIRSAASRGALSHALLFTGSGDRVAAARFAAAAMTRLGYRQEEILALMKQEASEEEKHNVGTGM